MDYFAGNNPEGKTLRELTGEPMRCIPAFRRPDARLELLDEQGIQASLMFPTLASLIEERLLDDPALTQVALRAFNDWLYDECPSASAEIGMASCGESVYSYVSI